MPTEAQKERIRVEVARLIGVETNEAFAKRAGVDPQTLGDFLAGRRWPRRATLDKIEAGLRLTPGTLAALGEEADSGAAQVIDVRDVDDAQLIAELSYRLESANRLAEQFRDEAVAMGAAAALENHRSSVREVWLRAVEGLNESHEGHVAQALQELWDQGAEGEIRPEDRDVVNYYLDLADMHALALEYGYTVTKLDGGTTEAEKSADEAVTPNIDPDDWRLAARRGDSVGRRLREQMDGAGEESQDGAMTDE